MKLTVYAVYTNKVHFHFRWFNHKNFKTKSVLFGTIIYFFVFNRNRYETCLLLENKNNSINTVSTVISKFGNNLIFM